MPKAENKSGLLGKKPVAEAPRKRTVFWAWKPPKMHRGPTLSINFISFTAEMHCLCSVKKATLASWEPWSFGSPSKSGYGSGERLPVRQFWVFVALVFSS